MPAFPLCYLSFMKTVHPAAAGRSSSSDFRTTPVYPSIPSLLTLGQAVFATAKISFIYSAESFERNLNSWWISFITMILPNTEWGSKGSGKFALEDRRLFPKQVKKAYWESLEHLHYAKKADRAFGDTVSCCLPRIKHPLPKRGKRTSYRHSGQVWMVESSTCHNSHT